MVHSVSPLSPLCEIYAYTRPYEVLASQNATLRLRASDGKIYSFTDLICAYGSANFGHMNPSIDPFRTLTSDVAAGYYPPSAATYAAWLLAKLKTLAHAVLYQVGPSFAVSSAIAMAQRVRPGKILTIDGSAHGPALARIHNGVLSLPPAAEFSAWDDVSCLLYEPVQSASGYLPLPAAWLRALSQSAQAAGVTVIADESECGFYRFGYLSLATEENLAPDIHLFGKSLTNGLYPLSAVVYPKSFHTSLSPSEEPWNQTLQTASLGFEAATAVAAYIDSNDIAGMIVRIHAILAGTVENLAANPAYSAFHLAGPTLSFEVRDGGAAELVRKCEECCVLISSGGAGRRVRVAPPLTIPIDQFEIAIDILEKAAAAL